MHGRGRCWTRSAPGSSVSTETRSKMGRGDCGHGNDMARRRQARPWSEDRARGREWRGEQGGKGAGAHRESVGADGELGEAATAANRRRRSSVSSGGKCAMKLKIFTSVVYIH